MTMKSSPSTTAARTRAARCPRGLIYGKRVACPLHNWQIDLASGEAQAPDVGCAHQHHARCGNGRVTPALRDAELHEPPDHRLHLLLLRRGLRRADRARRRADPRRRGRPGHPANFGKLCSKGSSLHLTGDLAARALYPELRLGKGLARSPHRLGHRPGTRRQRVRRHHRRTRPGQRGLLHLRQLLTEDYYSFNKLARALVGTNNIDSNSRLCMSSAVVGYKRSLGADAPPCSYEDLENSDCVMIVGSNMAYAHPVLFRRLEEAKARRPQMKVLVIDPRRTDTCDLADLHLAILPGTDVALFHGILHSLLWEDWIDRALIQAHTEGLAELKTPGARLHAADGHSSCAGSASSNCACVPSGWAPPAVFLSLWCMGLNQSTAGSAKNSALINLHLATGHHRPPRRRAVLPDRPAQCHGRARNRQLVEPAAGPP